MQNINARIRSIEGWEEMQTQYGAPNALLVKFRSDTIEIEKGAKFILRNIFNE